MAHHLIGAERRAELEPGGFVGPRRGSQRLGQVVRSMTVSVATSAISLTILAALTLFTPVPPAGANVIATLAGIGPSFALNRRWVWKRSAPGHLRREVLPFWAYALAALVLSTVAVDLVADWADGAALSPAKTTAAVLGANVTAFGVLWCGQFVLLDRLLTRSASDVPGGSAAGSRHRETSPGGDAAVSSWGRNPSR